MHKLLLFLALLAFYVLPVKSSEKVTQILNVSFANDYCTNDQNAPKKDGCNEFWASYGSNVTKVWENGMRWMKENLIDLETHNINEARLWKVFAKLHRGETVNVFIFGGSMTAGRWVKGVAGAWPAELSYQWSLLQQAGKVKGNVVQTNLAVGGTSTAWLLERITNFFHHVDSLDLVIIDYDVNDGITHLADNDKSRTNMQSDVEVKKAKDLKLLMCI